MIGYISIILIYLCVIYLSFCAGYLYAENKANKKFEMEYESWKHDRILYSLKNSELLL